MTALLVGAHDLSAAQLKELKLPLPEKLLPCYDDEPVSNAEDGNTLGCQIQNQQPCFLAAEIYMQLGRFEEALAYNTRTQEYSALTSTFRINPWQRARILAGQRLAEGKGAPWTEIIALFEESAKEGEAWGTQLIVVFALKDMLALVPKSELGDHASMQSRLEELLFELTMEEDTALKRHLDSGEAFMPKDVLRASRQVSFAFSH